METVFAFVFGVGIGSLGALLMLARSRADDSLAGAGGGHTTSTDEGDEGFFGLQAAVGAVAAPPDRLALKEAEVLALRERLRDLEALGKEIAELEKRHIAERERLEAERAAALAAAEEERVARGRADRRWKALKTRQEKLRARLDDLPSDLRGAEAGLARAREEAAKSLRRVAALEKRAERTATRLARREASLERARGRIARLEQNLAASDERVARAEQDLLEAREQIGVLYDQLAGPSVSAADDPDGFDRVPSLASAHATDRDSESIAALLSLDPDAGPPIVIDADGPREARRP